MPFEDLREIDQDDDNAIILNKDINNTFEEERSKENGNESLRSKEERSKKNSENYDSNIEETKEPNYEIQNTSQPYNLRKNPTKTKFLGDFKSET